MAQQGAVRVLLRVNDVGSEQGSNPAVPGRGSLPLYNTNRALDRSHAAPYPA